MRGWVVEYDDGRIIHEWDGKEWRKIPKIGIRSVSLVWDSKKWSISNKEAYLPPTTS